MLKILLLLLINSQVFAAVTWTPQPERYNTYNATPTRAKQTIVRVPVNDIEAVRPEWVKIGDEWIKQVSSGGAVRYVAAPPVDECIAQFVCHTKWGWVINLSKDTVMKCPSIKIRNEQIAFYDSVNMQAQCPSVIK